MPGHISLLIPLKLGHKSICQKQVIRKWREKRYMHRTHEFWCNKVFIKFMQAVLSFQPKQSWFTLDLSMLLCVKTYESAMDLS